MGEENITAPLLLAVEVLSPSTRAKDLILKRSLYEDSGVSSYWVIDPDEPSVLVHELEAGTYVARARTVGAERLTLTAPFELTVVPADLLG